MPRVPDRVDNRRDSLLALACFTLALLTRLVPAPWTEAMAGGVRATALAPLVWMQARAEEGRTSRARYRAVEAERDRAAMAAQSVPALEAENARLRGMVGLGARLAMPYIPAAVLHQATPTDGRTLLLGAGSAEGVRPFMPVVAPEGLVGVVSRVELHSSVALTWAHPEFRASATTADGAVQGIVAPSGNAFASETVLEFRGVAFRDTIPDDALIVTSGLAGVYPRGIPIGRMAGVRREQLGWERIYGIRPAASPGHLAHVMILRLPGDTVSGRAFLRDTTP